MDTNSWLDVRAAFLLALVELLLFFAVLIPIESLSHIRILSKELILAMAILTGVKSYFILFRNEAWKSLIEEFDQLPEQINKKYKKYFWVFIISLVALFALELFIVAVTSKY